jgi:hypothetical protein
MSFELNEVQVKYEQQKKQQRLEQKQMDSELQSAEEKLAELQRQLKEKEQENRIGKLRIKELRRLERAKQLISGYRPSEKSFTRESTASLPPIKQNYNPYEQVPLEQRRNSGRKLVETRVSKSSLAK